MNNQRTARYATLQSFINGPLFIARGNVDRCVGVLFGIMGVVFLAVMMWMMGRTDEFKNHPQVAGLIQPALKLGFFAGGMLLCSAVQLFSEARLKDIIEKVVEHLETPQGRADLEEIAQGKTEAATKEAHS